MPGGPACGDQLRQKLSRIDGLDLRRRRLQRRAGDRSSKSSATLRKRGLSMATNSILIVDDNPVNLKLVRILLAGEGYAVRTAADAEEALQVLKESNPELILMDVQLPGIDGLELTRRLKMDPATR